MGAAASRRHGGWVVDTEDGPVFGPGTLDPQLRERLAAGEGEPFRMGETVSLRRGGRRELVYDIGRYLGPPAHRSAPLLEYGFPWSGVVDRLRHPRRLVPLPRGVAAAGLAGPHRPGPASSTHCSTSNPVCPVDLPPPEPRAWGRWGSPIGSQLNHQCPEQEGPL
jgi:hypothetical protein